MHRLILVRHCDEEPGLPPWPRLTDLHAWHEMEGERPLTQVGERRAAALAAQLAPFAPARIMASPLLRAAQTADAIAKVAGLDVEDIPELAEVAFGHVAGFEPRTTFGSRRLLTRIPAPRFFWPPFMRGLWLLGLTRGVFSKAAVVSQSEELKERLTAESRDRTVLVVAHGVILLYLHAALLEDQFLPAFKTRHLLKTGEFRVLDFAEQRWRETARGRGIP